MHNAHPSFTSTHPKLHSLNFSTISKKNRPTKSSYLIDRKIMQEKLFMIFNIEHIEHNITRNFYSANLHWYQKWKCYPIRYGQSNLNYSHSICKRCFKNRAVFFFWISWTHASFYNYIHLINVNSTVDFIYLFWLRTMFLFSLFFGRHIERGFAVFILLKYQFVCFSTMFNSKTDMSSGYCLFFSSGDG